MVSVSTTTAVQRILVVDDDQQIVHRVSSSLEAAGFAVLTAGDGETAMHVIHRELPDLIVLNVSLASPGRDGDHPLAA